MSDDDLKRRESMTFLEAEGLVPLRQLQKGPKLTQSFRAQAFEIIKAVLSYDGGGYGGSVPGEKTKAIWTEYFGFFSDTLPYAEWEFHKRLQLLLDSDPKWLDFIQSIARKRFLDRGEFAALKRLLENEMIGYRFIGQPHDGTATLMPISDEAEAQSNQADYAGLNEHKAAQEHFRMAVERLASGDYRGSVTESIHGVESVAKKVSGNINATLGDALKVIEKQTPLHPALSKGLGAIYGWTSQADGIRHAMSDAAQPVDEAEARFMLSACLAFAAWLRRAANSSL